MSENSPEKGGLNVFMFSVVFHKRQNASFNLTNQRLGMNAGFSNFESPNFADRGKICS